MPKHLALLLLCCITLPTLAEPPRTFAEAKKIAWSLYAQQSVEFYCGCRYNGNRVDLKSCGYQPRKNPQRAARIEWDASGVGVGHRPSAPLLATGRPATATDSA